MGVHFIFACLKQIPVKSSSSSLDERAISGVISIKCQMDLQVGSKWICFKSKSSQGRCSTHCGPLQSLSCRKYQSHRRTQRYLKITATHAGLNINASICASQLCTASLCHWGGSVSLSQRTNSYQTKLSLN